MGKITVVGSLNMDLVVMADRMPKGGETVSGRSFHAIPGGKGANQAVAMARLGGSVEMIGRVGADGYGVVLVEGLQRDGVGVSCVDRCEAISTGVALITVSAEGENAIVVVPGANGCLTPELDEEEARLIRESDTLVVQLEIPMLTVESVVALSKDSGGFVILNPAPAQRLSQKLLEQIDLLTPNETELSLLSELPTDTIEQVETAAKFLLERGVKAIVVTLGKEGALYLDQMGKRHYEKGLVVDVVDTTAAGDSFTAALAVALNGGETIENAMNFACRVGALTVQKLGAQSSLPYLAELNPS